MQPKKFRILSASTGGSLALTAAAISVSSGTSQAATHAALTARTESLPSVNSAGTPPGQLDPGQLITSGTQIASPDGKFVLQMQSDGNLVIRVLARTARTYPHRRARRHHCGDADGRQLRAQSPGQPPHLGLWHRWPSGHSLAGTRRWRCRALCTGHQVLSVLFPAVLNLQNNAPPTAPPARFPRPLLTAGRLQVRQPRPRPPRRTTRRQATTPAIPTWEVSGRL